jgi:predicted nucleic acid-binding protein
MVPSDVFILDASVAAKWFNKEDFTDKAIAVRDAFVQGRIRLLAPAQMVYEVGNSVWKNNKELTAEDATTAIQALMDIEIELVPLSQELASSAMRIARDSSITFYDAAYIALADHFNAILISTDAEILSKRSKVMMTKENSIHVKDFHL